MSAEQAPAGDAGIVYEYQGPFGESGPLRAVAVSNPATKGHVAISGDGMPWLGDLSAEEVAAFEPIVIKGALVAQKIARHMSGLLPGSELIYRLRRDAGNGRHVEHLVPRYPELGDAGDPMLNVDPYLLAHGHDVRGSKPSRYKLPSGLAAETDAQLALVDAFFDLDYPDYESDDPIPHGGPGTDILDRILSGEVSARVAYEHADVVGVIDRNPANRDHIFFVVRACVKNWWELPPAVLAQLAVAGLYSVWHKQRNGGGKGAVAFVTANKQVPHTHEHAIQNEPHSESLARMSPHSSRMGEKHPDEELDDSRRFMQSEELKRTLDRRLQHVRGFFAAMRAITPERKTQ